MKYVLFVCNHNAGRSQMAQAFFERHAPDAVRADSAGTAPTCRRCRPRSRGSTSSGSSACTAVAISSATARTPMRSARSSRTARTLVFGHTHKPWVREYGGVLFVNCGSVGKPKDGDPRAAFAILTAAADAPAVT